MGLEKLDTGAWLVQLTENERGLYSALRLAESEFLDICKQNGCQILQGLRRQALVLVPPGVQIPAINESRYDAWSEILSSAAHDQAKKSTIGIRSSQPPRWFNGEKWQEHRPTINAISVTERKNTAARGASISANEALNYLNRSAEKAAEVISNSIRAGQKSRAAVQIEKLSQLRDSIFMLRRILAAASAAGQRVSAQLISGLAWTIYARFDDDSVASFSVPSVGLLAVTADVKTPDVRRRTRPIDGDIIDVPPLRLIVHHHPTSK